MKVYVFGNPDFEGDTVALKAVEKIKGKVNGVGFITVNPNEDLPFAGEDNVIIMDAVQGIKEVTLIDQSDLDKLKIDSSVTAHDFDLGFQLKYLKKLDKLKKITIIGLPQTGNIDYSELTRLLDGLCHSEFISASYT
ncbi:hypothetical protein JW766_05390 [Candidatus Dojkabacteria bacterium]|nr:hypothetical protein [Candidatus Dojkabacteria bacterium]